MTSWLHSVFPEALYICIMCHGVAVSIKNNFVLKLTDVNISTCNLTTEKQTNRQKKQQTQEYNVSDASS